MANKALMAAKSAQNDEFYTQYHDIESEINAYVEFNPDVFRGKTVLLPCDDPEWSNFTKYFCANFNKFGLKRLISTSYALSSGAKQLTLFEQNSPLFDSEKHETKGKKFVMEANDLGALGECALEFKGYLEGNGDFRSEEITSLRDESDIIITNPPFSLFREFLDWILKGNKQFAILGNMNAITYKEVFPFLKGNRIWLGYKPLNAEMYFDVPEERRSWLKRNKKEGSAYKIIDGVVMGRLASACWFTNIEHGKRHKPLLLESTANNLKFNKPLIKKLKEEYGTSCYPSLDNYDAVEVPYVDAIPSDCYATMAVPITFLDKYNPEQFEIEGITLGNTVDYPMTRVYDDAVQHNKDGTIQGGSKVNTRAAVRVNFEPNAVYYTASNRDGYLLSIYPRVLVRHRG